MFRYWYLDDAGNITEIVGRVEIGAAEQPGSDGLVMNAEEGSTGTSQVTVEDPNGDFNITGHRLFYVTETESAGDDYSGIVYLGYAASREVNRERDWIGPARTWVVDLVDVNSIFERRIFTTEDANRPAETDAARIAWALTTVGAALITDTTYFSTDGPFDMDAVDYRGQNLRQVFDDCSQQSGKNWYLWVKAADDFSLWYGPRYTTDFTSQLRITTDRGELDEVTFLPSMTTKLRRDPERVFSGIYTAFANSHSYVQRNSTAVQFTARDTTSPVPNVKTLAKANARANRELTDIASEEDIISTAVIVPRAQANIAVAGQRVAVLLPHLPGPATNPGQYADWVWLRVMNRTVRDLAPGDDEEPGFVELAMDLGNDEPYGAPGHPNGEPGGGSGIFGILRRSAGPQESSNLVLWGFPGDNPTQPGYPTQPTTGLIEPVLYGGYVANPDNPWAGWQINGTGTVDVHIFMTAIAVRERAEEFVVTAILRKNGITQHSAVYNVGGDGTGLTFWEQDITLDVEALAVAPGDFLDVTLSCTPHRMAYFMSPWGTGQAGEQFTITGGSLT